MEGGMQLVGGFYQYKAIQYVRRCVQTAYFPLEGVPFCLLSGFQIKYTAYYNSLKNWIFFVPR